jgi:hypothetical protein
MIEIDVDIDHDDRITLTIEAYAPHVLASIMARFECKLKSTNSSAQLFV